MDSLLPSATKLRRLCFYTCLSVHKGGGQPQCMLGYHHPPGAGIPTRSRHPPPQQTATVADGTHPTGMHSCSTLIILWFKAKFSIQLYKGSSHRKKRNNLWMPQSRSSHRSKLEVFVQTAVVTCCDDHINALTFRAFSVYQ